MKKEIARGAEAIIFLEEEKVLKKRVAKSYRIPEIDIPLRTSRTRRESKILEKLKGLAPKLISAKENELEMEYIKGNVIKNILDKNPKLAREIGKKTGLMHDQNIIHGDLTTSNMILDEKKENGVRFVDFGLSFVSTKVEDMAVDLHLFREAVESKHYRKMDEIWTEFLKAYQPKKRKEILERLEIVEQRGRNKANY